VAVVLAACLATVVLSVQIRRSSTLQPTERADVLIVLGAGVLATSPDMPGRCYRPRLDHARDLLGQGLAPRIIVTELSPGAEVARDYLLAQGVPDSAIVLENQSVNTWENLYYARGIMGREGWRTAIVVTCPFHLYRSMRIARDLGIPAQGAAAPNSPTEEFLYRKIKYTLRECVIYAKYRVAGP